MTYILTQCEKNIFHKLFGSSISVILVSLMSTDMLLQIAHETNYRHTKPSRTLRICLQTEIHLHLIHPGLSTHLELQYIM